MFDQMLCDYFEPSDTAQSRDLIEQLNAFSRQENQAAAQRLRVIAELFELRREERGELEHWAVDTWAAVGAEVAAALRVSLAKAGSLMNYALAMRRLPRVSAVFTAGDIDFQLFQAVVFRTHLITDSDAAAAVDADLAARVARWPSMTRGRLATYIDRVVGQHDPDAVRRVRDRARSREVNVWSSSDGCSDLSGRLFATDAAALDKRLHAMATSVCEADPRTIDERRADALGALATGAERLACRCGQSDCPVADAPGISVIVHVVADQATLDGTGRNPAYLLDTGELISPELLAELTATARQRPLVIPTDAPAETRYRPSRALADFVRARDLTCRAPGCDKAATRCDIDHTVPWPAGPTQATNLKCLCREHHVLKTFWGWRDRQLPDGTVIWELPDGHTYVTTPGSILLFPALMAPTGPAPAETNDTGRCADRSAMMPRRPTTRAQNRAHHIANERAHNRAERRPCQPSSGGPSPPGPDGDEPPF
ncbi:DUF222 domain-containing protein [Mycolicibacterium sp. CBM1]